MRDFITLPLRPLYYLWIVLVKRELRNVLLRPYVLAILSFLACVIALPVGFHYWGPDLRWWWDLLLVPSMVVAASIFGFFILLIGTELNFDEMFEQFHVALELQKPSNELKALQVTAIALASLIFRSLVMVLVLVLTISSLWTPGLNLLISFITAVFLAYDFYVAPCQARGKGWRWQLGMMARDGFYTIAFGYTMLLYLAIPLLGMLMTPIGTMVAIRRLETTYPPE